MKNKFLSPHAPLPSLHKKFRRPPLVPGNYFEGQPYQAKITPSLNTFIK